MSETKVTVITVARNAADTIGSTIESVLTQAYRNVEYLVIDGASSDGTLGVIQKYEKQISRFLSEPDQGVADAFNKGTALATGDAVLFLNAGDRFVDSNSVERLLSQIPQGVSIREKVIYGDWVITLPSGGCIPAKADHNTLRTSKLWKLCHQSALIGIDIQRRFPYDTRLSANMDYDFWLRCLAADVRFEHVEGLICNYLAGGISGDPRFAVARTIEGAVVRLMNKRTPKTVAGVAELFKDAAVAEAKQKLKSWAGIRFYLLVKRSLGFSHAQ